MSFLWTLLLLVMLPGCTTTLSYGVALTTIPPRFNSVHHTLQSWQQQQMPPAVILIFVPRVYRRFRRKIKPGKSKNDVSYVEELTRILTTRDLMTNIVVVETEDDFGPILKYYGLYEFIQNNRGENLSQTHVTHWIVGDDDVAYTPSTISVYNQELICDKSFVSNSCVDVNKTILTHYRKDYRLLIDASVDGEVTDQENRIMHFQGVDTILFPSMILRDTPVFNSAALKLFIPWMFSLCEGSFYQDDYIVSLLIHLTKFPTRSLWNGQRVAGHVDDVSKSNFQLHMHHDVFVREYDTQQCLQHRSSEIVRMLKQLLL
jgi:hypothetical protein